MTDDTIRSMKEQMVPSDDIISDLLAKIAAEEASPEPMLDNVVAFDKATAPKAKKFTTKSIWRYSTVAVASIIVLLSTFAVFNGSNDGSQVKEIFDNITNNAGTVTKESDSNSSANSEDTGEIESPQNSQNSKDNTDGSDSDKKEGSFLSNILHLENTDKANTVTDKDNSDEANANNSHETNANQPSDENSDNSNNANSNDSQNTIVPPKNDEGNAKVPETDDSKVTPGQSDSADIEWTREILAESSVSQISVSGNNYVVDTPASSSVVGSKISTLALDIPYTSTTNPATVKATVNKVKNASSDLVVAVEAEGFSQPLIYTNSDYKPETLGQFVSDAGLDNAAYSKWAFCKGDNIGFSSYTKVSVSNMASAVSSYLFADSSASLASHNSYQSGTTFVQFKCTDNPLNSVINFGVSDNGYLYVKLQSGKSFTFHIGKGNAESFIAYVAGEK